MQTRIFQCRHMNDIQNYIINNNLEDVFKLTERDLVYASGAVYSFYSNNKLVEVFEIETLSKIDYIYAYQYMLGFLDAYVMSTNKQNFSLQSKVNK